jgi:general secretion pathway protein A
MIPAYFNLREQPFGATPDSRYLFESETHREALASLLYGIEANRGFFVLVAMPGMGKTTLLFNTLSQLRGKAKTVYIFQTIYTPIDFLRALLLDLGIRPTNGSIVELQRKLADILLELSSRGERLVVVVDEAQKLEDSVLELIRMLSNFETSKEKLMQVILSGQPELARKLASPNLLQLRQRISIVSRLQPLCFKQVEAYIEHRLRVAGWNSKDRVFTPEALHLIAEHSGGIPRNINNLCFNSLSLCCALKRRTVDDEIVREVIADLDLDSLGQNELLAIGTKPRAEVGPVSSFNAMTGGAWLTRAVVVSVLMLALSGINGENGKAVRRRAIVEPASQSGQSRVQASADVTPLLPAAPFAETKTQSKVVPATQPLESEIRLLVPPGATLSQLCAKTLITCRSMDIKTIQHLNPWLTDPDLLVSGKELRIPIRKEISSAAAQLRVPVSYGKQPMEVARQ